MKTIETLNDKGIDQTAVIIATGHSYEDIHYNKISDDYTRFEINKMRVDTRIDYSMYYDEDWKQYFNENGINDNRKLIGFEINLSKYADYKYNTQMIPFSDSGFHALYIGLTVYTNENVVTHICMFSYIKNQIFYLLFIHIL